MDNRIKRKDVQALTAKLLKEQGYKCPLCHGPMRAGSKKQPVLDHDHQTGAVRGVLCRNCNGIEGKVFNLARRAKNNLSEFEWLVNLARYWKLHSTPQHGGIFHHTHKTDEEKRIERNRKARERRAKAKAQQ